MDKVKTGVIPVELAKKILEFFDGEVELKIQGTSTKAGLLEFLKKNMTAGTLEHDHNGTFADEL